MLDDDPHDDPHDDPDEDDDAAVTATPHHTTSPQGLAALRELCGGAVHLPGDAAYDSARLPWNLRADSRPAAVAYPAFPEEVADVVRAAADLGLRVAPQGTGHGAPAIPGDLSDAVLLRTSAMTHLDVDAEGALARVGAGVRWGEVVRRAGAHGLACRHMSSPDVGVVGSSLGGGLSWYGRRHGLQSSAVTAVEVVLADGSAVRATGEDDLLWACRGGGGGVGVVTAMEFELLPIATAYAGMLVWDWAQAPRVLRTWSEWATDAPEDATTVARLFQVPDLPEIPDGVRGRQVVVIDGAVLGDPRAAARLLAPLRALRPDVDTFDVVPAASLAQLHLEPQQPTAAYAGSVLLDVLPDAAVEALVATAGPGSGTRLTYTEVRQLGGALSRPSPGGGALDHVAGAFLVLSVGVDDDPAGWAALEHDAERVFGALRPWTAEALYLPMVEDEAADARRGWARATWDRLNAVRAAADPDGLFVLPHTPAR